MNQQESRNGNGSAAHPAGLGQRVDVIGEDAQKMVSDAKGLVEDFVKNVDLKGRVDRSPYGMIALAAGIGYVLGGGLFTPLTGRLVRIGMRLAALPLVKDELAGFAEAALDGLSGSKRDASKQ